MNILVGSDWKTTAAGWLSGLVGTAGPVAAYLAASNNPKTAAAAGLVALVGVIGRVWIGILQNYIQSDPNIGKLANPAVVTVNTTGPTPDAPEYVKVNPTP